MAAVPAETPVTTPVVETVATAVLLLVHVPPVIVSTSEMVAPVHTDSTLPNTLTPGFTVSTAVVKQPVGNV